MSDKPAKEPKYKILFGAIGAIAALFAIFFGLFKFCTGRESLRKSDPTEPANASTTTTLGATTTSKPTTTATKMTISEISNASKVGDIVRFGEYNWRVLAVENGKALLIAEEVIEMLPYNDEHTGVTWETCSLRTYLNGEFFENFNAQERAIICETENVNFDNQWFGTDGGNATEDKIFLLSLEEVVKYFGDSGQLKNKPAEDARFINDQYNDERVVIIKNEPGMSIPSPTEYNWWLRSPGRKQEDAAYVWPDGKVLVYGRTASIVVGIGVRPALWLKLT